MFSAHILIFLSQEHSVAEHELEREMCEFAYLIIIHSGGRIDHFRIHVSLHFKASLRPKSVINISFYSY